MDILTKQSLQELLELVKESEGNFIILEKEEPRLAVLDFNIYKDLVDKANRKDSAEAAAGLSMMIFGGVSVLRSKVSNILLEQGHKVTVVNGVGGNQEGLPEGTQYLETDLSDLSQVKALFKNQSFDCVIYLGETSGHSQSFKSPEYYFLSNVETPTNFLKAAAANGVKKFVYASTVDRNSPYAKSKLIFEQMLEYYAASAGISSVSLRIPYLAIGEESGGDLEELLMDNPLAAVMSIASGQSQCLPVPYVGDITSDGTPKIEIAGLEDAASALAFCASTLQVKDHYEVVVLDGFTLSIGALIDAVMDATHHMVPTFRAEAREFWLTIPTQNIARLSQKGWKPLTEDVSDLLEPDKAKPTSDSVAAEGDGDGRTFNEPVSLSDLLSGKYTPFIKSHNS